MATIEFYANILPKQLINHTAGSGLGFYGTDFGVSVPIGSQQETTFVTDAEGVNEGVALNNTQYANDAELDRAQSPGKVVATDYGQTPMDLDELPNYLVPLNIRFTHNTAVKTQNCKLRIFDRNNINNHASGVATYVYETRHPNQSVGSAGQLDHKAPGVTTDKWFVFEDGYRNDGSELETVEDMSLTNSPGAEGLNTSPADQTLEGVEGSTREGNSHRSTQHDWYVAISSEPNTIGSKTDYGLYFSLEYL